MGLVAPQLWDLPEAGTEPVAPALAGRFISTVPPGKSLTEVFQAVNFPLKYRLIQIKLYPINSYRSYFHNHSAKNIFYVDCNLFIHGKP